MDSKREISQNKSIDRKNDELNISSISTNISRHQESNQQVPSNSTTLQPITFNSFPSNNRGHYGEFFPTSTAAIKQKDIEQHEQQNQNIFNIDMQSSADSSSAIQFPNSFKSAMSNMSSLPDYFSQLPVAMPSMPQISIPSIAMPAIPNLSMPNIQMPNLNLSLSNLMSNSNRNLKTWEQINATVRECRKRFSSVCPLLPFDFKFRYNPNRDRLRIYFLVSTSLQETTFYYCDVLLRKDLRNENLSQNSKKNKLDSDDESKQTSNLTNKLIDHVSQSEMLSPSIEIAIPGSSEKKHRKISINENNLDRFNKEYSNRSYMTSHHIDNHNFDMTDCEYDADNNVSSPTSITLSSSSNDSFIDNLQIDSLKDIGKSNLETLDWKQLVKINFDFPDIKEWTSDSAKNHRDPCDISSSHEEDLILQRKRILSNGICSYDFNPYKARFVFTMKDSIFWFDDLEINHKINQPVDTRSNQNDNRLSFSSTSIFYPPYNAKRFSRNKFAKINATICPDQPDLVAYIADNDLWVCDLISNSELRLTNTKHNETAIMAGKPSFVMQEEFSRFEGFWWRPLILNYDHIYTILCEFVDESQVDRISIPSWSGASEIHHFPKAGTKNAKSTLKLIHFTFNSTSTTTTSTERLNFLRIEDLPVNLEEMLPEFEYILSCNWLSNDVIWVQLLNRRQNHLVIVFVSISKRFPAQIIYEEKEKDHWYNRHQVFHILNKSYSKIKNYSSTNENVILNCDLQNVLANTDKNIITVGSQIEFLWSSEITGFRHLYKITVEIVDSSKNSVSYLKSSETGSTKEILLSRQIENIALTSGNWEVSDSLFWVNEEKDLIYFVGNKDSPLENHLYVISLTFKVLPRRLTEEDYTHTCLEFDPFFEFCIDFQSNLSKPPFGYLHKVIHDDSSFNVKLEPYQFFIEEIKRNEDSECLDKVQIPGLMPQLFEYKLQSGELIHGFLFKPNFMEPGFKYPVVLDIYGGPEVQCVTKSFCDLRNPRRHLIASQGYIVVGFDSRGSKHRGVQFEKHIYKRLGQVEIDDQVEALQWLADKTNFMDLNRVAIHGWSYGGYLALMALVKRPDIFKCAIAGAPVTDWYLYDTGYTERYLGLPDENEEGYRKSNVLTYIKSFPNEYNRLLIIHGLMDDNVHFSHTAQLIQGLIMAGKPYNLKIFPFERHSLKKSHTVEHCDTTLIHYLQQNL